ncbi:paired amphipathic helix protein Sin3-like 1 [Trifolium pratense]|nr:paired amphipathic helix protein Sin3-like 1 [Trifolium pratense]
MMLERVHECATRDAFNFYDEVKNRFQGDKLKDFIIAFNDYKKQRDLGIFVEKMKEILEGHIDLILKFNTFMPKQYQIKDEKCCPKKRPCLEDATQNLREIKKMKDSSNTMDQISIDAAKMYLTEIEDEFKDDTGKYYEFLRAMRDFRTRRIDMAGLMSRVKELFKGHKKLLLKFNTFLPETSSKNTFLPDDDEVSYQPKKPTVDLEYAKKYLVNVKTQFQHEPHIYKSFLKIVNMYRNEDKSAKEVMQMVISLFEGHPDLVDGFMVFLG